MQSLVPDAVHYHSKVLSRLMSCVISTVLNALHTVTEIIQV